MNKQDGELLRKTLGSGNRGKLNYKKLTHKLGVIDYIRRKYLITEFDEYYYDAGRDRLWDNTWVEPYFVGNYGMTQERLAELALSRLDEVLSNSAIFGGRLYYAKKENELYLYYYGRDYLEIDYAWCLQKKTHS